MVIYQGGVTGPKRRTNWMRSAIAKNSKSHYNNEKKPHLIQGHRVHNDKYNFPNPLKFQLGTVKLFLFPRVIFCLKTHHYGTLSHFNEVCPRTVENVQESTFTVVLEL